MVDGCSIRRFSPSDFKKVDEVREAAFRPVFKSFREIVGDKIASVAFANAEREQAEYLESLCAPQSGKEVYVVERDGEQVAFFCIALDHTSKVGELDLNAVHPDHQGEGIAVWMYSWAIDRMKQAGMSVATVGTGGDKSHAPARRAYEKAGFKASLPNVHLYRSL